MTLIEQINQRLRRLDALAIGADFGNFEEWLQIKREIGELRDFAFNRYIESKTLPKTTPENTPPDALDAA